MNSKQGIKLFPVNSILIKNKIYKIKHNNEEYKNTKIKLLETQNLAFLDNSNHFYNEESDRKYSGYSSENSDDINYNPSPALKDKILSPGDDDICIQKSNFIKPDNFHEDDICFYNIKNLDSNAPFKNNEKKLLILDLDETLVHTSFQPIFINNIIIEPDITLKILYDNKYYNLYVLIRPYVYEFLREMSKIFIIYIFTASIKEYANPLLNELDKKKVITKRLYRENCTLTKEGKYVKNLNNFKYNLKDIILLDNNPISYSFNKNNGIPIKTWHNDKNDKELLKMINFLKFLSTVNDVRYYIQNVIKNNEINYYQVNTIIRQKINVNKVDNEENNLFFKQFEARNENENLNKNKSINNNTTPHKKINFNKDDNINTFINIYNKTEKNINNYNRSNSINKESQTKSNIIHKYKNSFSKNNCLSYFGKSCINSNDIKLNINSINFNLVNSKSFKGKKESRYTNSDKINKNNYFNYLDNSDNKENDKTDNISRNKIPFNKIIKNQNFFHKRILSSKIFLNHELNKMNQNNKNLIIDYRDFNNNRNDNNNNINISKIANYNYYLKNKNKKHNSIYSYNLKKNNNQKNIKNIFENTDYYNLNLYEEKNKSYNYNIIKNNDNEKFNKTEVNRNNNSNIIYYNNSGLYKIKKNNELIKNNIFENYNSSTGKSMEKKHIIKRNETLNEYKTFFGDKDNDIIINDKTMNEKNIKSNEKQKYYLSSIFHQKFTSKEPIKLKLLKKDIHNGKTKMKNYKESSKVNSQPFIINENYYIKRKRGLFKHRCNTELLDNYLDHQDTEKMNGNIENNNTSYSTSKKSTSDIIKKRKKFINTNPHLIKRHNILQGMV